MLRPVAAECTLPTTARREGRAERAGEQRPPRRQQFGRDDVCHAPRGRRQRGRQKKAEAGVLLTLGCPTVTPAAEDPDANIGGHDAPR